MRAGWSEREMEALRIVEKHCSRWSHERKDMLREDIERAMHDFASAVERDGWRYGERH